MNALNKFQKILGMVKVVIGKNFSWVIVFVGIDYSSLKQFEAIINANVKCI